VGTALVLIGDTLAPKPHLRNLVASIGAANAQLPEDTRIHYLVCRNYADLAVALKQCRDFIRMVIVGPGLDGNPEMVGRLLGRKFRTILVVDPDARPLAKDPLAAKKLEGNLRELGVTVVASTGATQEFYDPIVKDHVVKGLSSQLDLKDISPEERAELLDKRLGALTKFPMLPSTHERVSSLTDISPPKKWAEAIDPDIPVRNVVLHALNSVHYGFRQPIKTIEQAVVLSTTRTVRELVMLCTVRRLFQRIPEARVEQFWMHSVTAGSFARLFTLPASPAEQTPEQQAELGRFRLDEETARRLVQAELWKKFDIEREADPFTAGLLHDIGKVTMALCFEELLLMVDPIVDQSMEEHGSRGEIWAESCRSIERGLMQDMDHQLIGSRIAKRWGLAPWLQQVVAQHHDVSRKAPGLLKIVLLADVAANMLYSYPFAEGKHPLQQLTARLKEAVDGGSDLASAVESSLDGFKSILERLEVPDHLWQAIELRDFVQLCYAVAPRVRDVTAAFLHMTRSG
jgi:HD-like signal output (HDOD) protein